MAKKACILSSFETHVEQVRDENNRYVERFAKYPDGKSATTYRNFCETHDLKSLEIEDPILAHSVLSSIACGSNPWIFDAYRTLQEKFGDITSIGNDLVRAVIEQIQSRYAAILSIDLTAPRLDGLKDHIVTRTRRGKTTEMYDFCPVTDALAEAYGFDFRGIFGDIESSETRRVLQHAMGFTPEEIEAAGRIAPVTGDPCALALALFHHYCNELVPYVDHWHHLLDRDFSGFSRGGMSYMNKASEHEGPLFSKIRAIYVLECAGSEPGQNNKDHIAFTVDW